jgi:hypothetical protein
MQIPKGISGNEKSMAELTRDNEHLSEMLAQQFGLSKEFVGRIDALALPQKSAAQMGLVEALNFFMMSDLTRRWKLHRIYRQLRARGSSYTLIRRLRSIANRRVILTRRIAFLEQFRTIFYYWHVIHLPFSIVMFVVLSVHVGVAVAFGYTWIW